MDEITRLFKRIISEPIAPCKHRHVISMPAPGVVILRCTRCGEVWRGRMYLAKGEK